MSSIQRLEEGIRRAAQANDAEAVRALGTELRRLQGSAGGAGSPVAQTQASEPEGNRGGLAFLNRGIANVLGAPVDLVNAGLGAIGLPTSETPFLGSESIAAGMGVGGVRTADRGATPQSAVEYVGRGVGEAAGALLPFAGAAGVAANSASAVAQGAGRTMMQPFTQAPVRALAAETGAGAGAGVAAETFDRMTQENSRESLPGMLAEMGGAVVGGMGPAAIGAAVRASPIAGTAIRGAQKAVVPFTRAGAEARARDRVRSLAEDPDAARQALFDEPAARGPDGAPVLTPAQRTGDRRLIGLERAVRESDPATDLALRQRETMADQVFRQEIQRPARGVGIDQTRDAIGTRLQSRLQRMDDRVRQATERAESITSKISPQRRASESSTIVRQELEKALRAARAEERSLWGRVPSDAVAPTATSRETYKRIFETTAQAQRDNIPEKARQFLDRSQSNQAFGETTTVRELHGLYSAMRENARIARARDRLNEARIADEIADAAWQDLTSASVTGRGAEALEEARSFSAGLNERFSRGSVGRVLGSAMQGGPSLAPELTLDATIGRGGLRAAVSADELRAAIGDNPEAGQAANDYLVRRFSETAMRDGAFSAKRARDFLRANDELLDRFPALKKFLNSAEQAQDLAERTASRIGGRADRLRDPRQSTAARFLDAPIGQEIETVLRARNPGAAAAELRRSAARDPSGRATLGLKGGFLDYLIERARTGAFNEADQAILSGRAIRNVLQDPNVGRVANAFLSTQERNRLQRLTSEMSKLEVARGQVPNVGGVIDDAPNKIIDVIGRTLAARSGARLGQGTSGASLLTANFASRRMQQLLARLTNDHAEKLIREAITDPDLFRILLSPASVRSAEAGDRAASRIIETLTAVTGGQFSAALESNSEREPLTITVRPNQFR